MTKERGKFSGEDRCALSQNPRSPHARDLSPPETDHSQRAAPPEAPDASETTIQQLDELELELRLTRSEAQAARLDAKACRLEQSIRRLRRELPLSGQPIKRQQTDRLPPVDVRDSKTPGRDCAGTGMDSKTDSDKIGSKIDSATQQIESPDRALPSPPPRSRPNRGDGLRRIDPQQALKRSLISPASRTDASPPVQCSDAADQERPARPPNRRRSRAIWTVSLTLHALLFLALTLITFKVADSPNQITLAAAIAEPDTSEIESINFSPAPVPPEISIQDEAEWADPLGEIPPPSFDPVVASPAEIRPEPWRPQTDRSILSDELSLITASQPQPAMEFCGVAGGGKHFVYLVDSSGSMGDAFESARTELLRSIESLRTDQRFYVIFFDAEPDYMRLRGIDKNESRSVFATDQNKLAVRRWAMDVTMDRGRAPYEALPFAIELKPDAVFLLSDGEFPQRIEELLRRINRIDNLFGDQRRISTIHTISYHSREGEERMRRIASVHGGQYRHVAKTKD